MKPFLRMSSPRSRRCLSSVACARDDASSARSSADSSVTRSAPFLTPCPSSKAIFSMRPAISGRMITDSSARRLPTALVSISARASFAGTALTGIAAGFCCPHAGSARQSTTAARTRTARFYSGRLLRRRGDAQPELEVLADQDRGRIHHFLLDAGMQDELLGELDILVAPRFARRGEQPERRQRERLLLA